jgi:hypothetical protein
MAGSAAHIDQATCDRAACASARRRTAGNIHPPTHRMRPARHRQECSGLRSAAPALRIWRMVYARSFRSSPLSRPHVVVLEARHPLAKCLMEIFSMANDEVTFKFVNMEQALMFRAALQTLADFIPWVDEAIRQYAHLDTISADKGEIQT